MKRYALGMLGLVFVACSGDSTAPEPALPGINIVAGPSVTDTIDTRLATSLRVRVLDQSGKPLARTEVRFGSRPVDVAWLNLELLNAFVRRDSDPTATAVAIDTTDADGYAQVRVVLGDFAAPATIAVTVPAYALTDTARYTVLPGAPFQSNVYPADTAVTIGATFAVTTGITDRNGNPVPGATTLRSTYPTVTVSASGAVTTTATPARAGIVASSGTARPDTAWVSVLPIGQFAAVVGGALAVMPLDGGSRQVIPTTLAPSDPQWTLDGSAFLVRLTNASGVGSIYRIDLNGNATVKLDGGNAPNGAPWLRGVIYGFAPVSDGSLLIASGDCNYMSILYRLPAGATSATRISPTGADDCFDTVHHFPSPSPDGTLIAFEHRTSYFTGSSIRLIDPANGSIGVLSSTGQRPQWSPRGDLIAFTDQDRIWVISPTGGSLRAVSPATHKYLPGVSWSPDGQWLLARYQNAQRNGMVVSVLDARYGLELPLPYTDIPSLNNFSVPAWRPVP